MLNRIIVASCHTNIKNLSPQRCNLRYECSKKFWQTSSSLGRICGSNIFGNYLYIVNCTIIKRNFCLAKCEEPGNSALVANKMVRILNVAEKNDAAKNLAEILSRGGHTRREGYSKYNKIYEFPTMRNGERCQMVMTSVSGHLLNHSFTGTYKKWQGCSPLDLFDTPVVKICLEDMQPIKRTLEKEARLADHLIIWTDCDREGENIGFEVISVCQAVKPNLQVFRAKFSEITFQSVNRAFENLEQPDSRLNEAVEVRSELDLRIGAAFTRFQTLRLQKVFPQALTDILISYGSCQFPTLGFVVERYKAIQNFIAEQFWKLKVNHEIENCVVEFLWKRVRLFDELACQVLHDRCLENPVAVVNSVKSRPKSKWRPQPLDTIELEKNASRKLRLNAKETMRIAEKLYTSGYISYPRTETNIFPKELNLTPLVQMQTQDQNWGEFASRILNDGPTPRQGKKSDQAHPPIHPTKYAANLQGNEQRVYEFIVRHFLACCSKDAKGTETVVDIAVNGEEFKASGLIILERNYLDVYPYDRWSDKEMPSYQQGQNFRPTSIEMVSGETSPPPLLTEADLISLMEKHGIGTDATHADHIETIKSRQYVGLQDTRFVPGELGMGLVEGYDAMGFQMSKPHLRAGLEADLKRICEGAKDPAVVLREQISNYRSVFVEALRQAAKIDEALAQFINEEPQPPPAGQCFENFMQAESVVLQCFNCGSRIVVKKKKDGSSFYLSCSGFPECKTALWFPPTVKNVEVTNEQCTQCAGTPKKLKFYFSHGAYSPLLPDEYTTCIGGCDPHFLETLGLEALRKRSLVGTVAPSLSSYDSGYSSSSSASNNSDLTRRTVLNNRTNNCHTNASNKSTFPNSNFISGLGAVNTTNKDNSGGRVTNNWIARQDNNSSQLYFGPTSQSNDESNAIVCNCNQDAIKLTVRKEGPNKGRQFYKCGKPQGQGCNFFLWADDPDSGDERLSSTLSGRNSQWNGGGTNSQWSSGGGNTSQWNGGSSNSFQSGRSSSFSGRNDDLRISGYGNQQGGFGVSGSSVSIQSQGAENSFNNEDSVKCNCGIPAKRLTTQKEGPNKGRQFYCCSKIRDEQCRFFQWADEVGNTREGDTHQWQSTTNRGRGRGRGGRTGSGGVKRKAEEATAQKRKCGICGEEGHNRRNCPNNF